MSPKKHSRWGSGLCCVSFTGKLPIRKGGRLVAIGTRSICSSQLENREGKIFLKGPLAHAVGARKALVSALSSCQPRTESRDVGSSRSHLVPLPGIS